MKLALSTALLAGTAIAIPTQITVANALKALAADPETCTSKSIETREWTLKDFDFHASYLFTTPAHQNSWGYVNFELINKNLDFAAKCSATSNWLDDFYYGNLNYNCTQPDGSNSEGTFNFSRPTNQLNVNQTWSCLSEGSRFYAEGGAALPLDCKDETRKNPNWPAGGFYSERTITCKNITMPLPITSMAAVA